MRQQIIDILLKCGIEEENVYCDNFIYKNILDSILMAEIIFSLEECYKIEFEAEDIIPENFRNIETILKMIKRYL